MNSIPPIPSPARVMIYNLYCDARARWLLGYEQPGVSETTTEIASQSHVGVIRQKHPPPNKHPPLNKYPPPLGEENTRGHLYSTRL